MVLNREASILKYPGPLKAFRGVFPIEPATSLNRTCPGNAAVPGPFERRPVVGSMILGLTRVMLPSALRKTPTKFRNWAVVKDEVAVCRVTNVARLKVVRGSVNVNGAPEANLTIELNCQPPTTRSSQEPASVKKGL